MNYRHAYHAGNFADVMKHAVLALVLEHLKLKPQPFRVIDTHAGIGRYDLMGPEAAKTNEWEAGIGRIAGADAAPLPGAIAALLAPYLEIVAALNPDQRLRHYPGSPLLALRLMRPADRLIANELHPEDAEALAASLAGDRRAKVMRIDGWIAVKSLLPPPERRGVVLIDPPYEQRDDLVRLARALAAAVERFATGTFLLWYPIKDRAPVERFHAAVAGLALPKLMIAELLIRPDDTPDRLNGAGLVIVNPPWTLEGKLALLLPFLTDRLGREQGAGYRLSS
ncbi:MAG: 23S rRNA (adenine(2030)-N(6))-methyltransferase RlmJ [Hyphomicrobiaceae bacterium]